VYNMIHSDGDAPLLFVSKLLSMRSDDVLN
jgi:hypothetical protein